MKISTEIGSAAHIVGERRTVELVARAGFDAWDFSMFTMVQFEDGVLLEGGHPLRTAEALKFARELKKIGLDNGIVCNQSHAPYPVNCNAPPRRAGASASSIRTTTRARKRMRRCISSCCPLPKPAA